MEVFGILDVPLWIFLMLACCVLTYLYGTYPVTTWKKYGVPSPPAAPFIGHMHQMYDPRLGMRASIQRWTDQYGKIFGFIFFRDPCLIITDIDILKEVFVKNFNNYVDRYMTSYDYIFQPIIKQGVFFNRGQDWKRIRRIMTPSFSSGKLKMLTHYINTTAGQLTDSLHKHAENGISVDAKSVFSAFSLDVLAGTAFGLELDSQNNRHGSFFQHAKGMVTFTPFLRVAIGTVGMFPFLGWIFRLMKICFLNDKDVSYFEKTLTDLVSERKAKQDEFHDVDFLQFLINAEADETDDLIGSKKLTTQEIVAQCIIFVIAGYETTSATLQWLSYELARHQDIQRKLQKEIHDVLGSEEEVLHEHCIKLKYMDAVINEALRMYPPVIFLTRIAQRATTLGGFSVPTGTAIFVPVYNIGRDPKLFEDPNTFNPDRFLKEQGMLSSSSVAFLPFGFGPRQCIGLRLAMVQMKIALVHMLRAMTIEDATPKKVEIDDFSGLLVPKMPIELFVSKN